MPLRIAILTALLLSTLTGSSVCLAAAPPPAQPAFSTGLVASVPLESLALNYSARITPVLLLHPARQTLLSMVAGFYAAATSRFNILPNSGDTISQSLDALPVIGTVRRRAGRRFNTDDASIDDFAICYRLTSRLGFQMIPGDPAPVKLAVTSLANNAGLTVGLTLRLSHR